MTDKLIRIQKLVNLMTEISDENMELRHRVKYEVDRHIRDALTMSFTLQPIKERLNQEEDQTLYYEAPPTT